MNLFSIFIFTLLLYPSIAFGNLANLQKFRLAKAKVALENNDHQNYKKLIRLNISTKVPHIDSLIHWGDYLFKQREFSKALRAYHLVIERLHSKKLLLLKNNNDIKKTIRLIPKPDEIVLPLYLKLADYYLFLLEEKSFNNLHKKRFHLKAEKYFMIVREYKYKLFYSTYQLGKLKIRNGNKEQGYQILTQAKEIPSRDKNHKKLRDEIELILAESLFHFQKKDSSQLYLRAIYKNPDTHFSSRDYAKYYFDSLEKDYFGASASYQITQKNNLHELTDPQRQEAETQTFKDQYGAENGAFHNVNLQAYINKKLKNKWAILGDLNLSTDKTTQEKTKAADRRFVALALDFKKFTEANSLYKINYTYHTLWTRSSSATNLQSNDAAHSLRPEYTYNKKSSSITWGGVLSFIKEDNDSKSAMGLAWSYQKHNRSNWWSPTYSVELLKQSEILNQPSSTVLNLSLSTPSLLSEIWTLYSALDITRNANAQSDLDFTRYELSFAAQREMNFLKNFYLDLHLRQSNKSRGDSQNISFLELGLGCTYNF